ncbi:hypothetical protein [Psychroflexus sp. MES1-P1E]|uniref:hypothetical protein n=1 Tax=Psychroflexus sp. MES1-P1E TaxID=2058320 RepID=UPI000C7C3028|nr:hypothetical protein [Psychroflexus sp. MES1-P1E]PKG42774.1 hypothetical protein CXF67_08485 [Psychroflexus sp. MES1-P1E]
MISLLPIHEKLSTLNGNDHVSAIISLPWLLDAIKDEMAEIEKQYSRVYVETNLKEIKIKFLFDHRNVRLTPVGGGSSFELSHFDFQLALFDPNNNAYGHIDVRCNKNIEGDFEIISKDDLMSDIKYNLEPVDLVDVDIQESSFDETVINANFGSLNDFETSVKAIMLFIDYNEYVTDLFDSLPTPNVFEALGSYKLGAPYNVSTNDFKVNGVQTPFLVVKGASIVDRSVFCNCGEPGGVTTVDDIQRSGSGDDGTRTTVNRRRVTYGTPVTGDLVGNLTAGFIFPFYDSSTNSYKTFLKDLTATTNLSTTVTDSGKTSGVNWSYNINASVPLTDIIIDVDRDTTTNQYSIIVDMPHKVTGKIKLEKKIGCGVRIRDSIELTQGRIDPFRLTLRVDFVQGRNGREVILHPDTKADLYFRLRPKGIFAFLVTFFGKIIDKKLVEERIVAIANQQITSFIRAFIIPTIPQEQIRIGATMLDESLFIAIGEARNDDEG